METCTETQVLRKSYLFEELGKYTNWEELDYIYSIVNYFSGNFKGGLVNMERYSISSLFPSLLRVFSKQ